MTEKVKAIKIDTEPGTTSVKALRDELRQLKETLLNVEAGTEEYNKTMQRAGDIQHQLKEQMEEINASAMDFGQIVGNATRAASGLAAGFQSVQAVMSLTGSESEEVTEAIKKMQSVMALTQGLAGIDNGIKAFKRLNVVTKLSASGLNTFKKALIGTGLGALVVVLGSIIANWDEFTTAIGLSEEKMKKFGEVVSGVMNVLKGSLKAVTGAITKAITGDFKGAWEQIKSGFDFGALYAEGVANKIAEDAAEAAKKSAKEWGKYVKERRKQLDEEAALREAKEEEGWKYTEEGKKYYDNYYEELMKLYKKDSSEYNKVLIDKLNYDKAYLKENQKEQEKTYQDEMKRIEVQHKLQLAELQKNLDDQLITLEKFNAQKKQLDADYSAYLKQLLEDETLNAEQRLEILEKLNNVRKASEDKKKVKPDKLSAEDEELQKEAIRYAAIEESYEIHLMNMQSKLDEALAKNLISETTYEKASEKLIKKKADFQVKSIAGAFNMAASILSSFADMEDENDKEGFERSKKLQIASATMQMIGGIVTALSGAFTTKSGPWDIALAAIQSATIAASTAAQIAKIQKMTFGGSGNVSTSTPSASAVATLSTPVQYTQDIQGASIESKIGDVKCYVLESEISKTQTKVNVAEHENRF